MLEPPNKATLNRLAHNLPDIPRWVETRSMWLSGRCEVFGLEEDGDPSFVVRTIEDVLIDRLLRSVHHPMSH